MSNTGEDSDALNTAANKNRANKLQSFSWLFLCAKGDRKISHTQKAGMLYQ